MDGYAMSRLVVGLALGYVGVEARSATVVAPDDGLYLCKPCGATCLPKNYMTDDYSDDMTDESNDIPWGCCYSGGKTSPSCDSEYWDDDTEEECGLFDLPYKEINPYVFELDRTWTDELKPGLIVQWDDVRANKHPQRVHLFASDDCLNFWHIGDTPVTGHQNPTLAPTTSAPTRKPTQAPVSAKEGGASTQLMDGLFATDDSATPAPQPDGQGYGMITRGCYGDGGHKTYSKPGTSLAMVACVSDAEHNDDAIKTGHTMTLREIVNYCGDHEADGVARGEPIGGICMATNNVLLDPLTCCAETVVDPDTGIGHTAWVYSTANETASAHQHSHHQKESSMSWLVWVIALLVVGLFILLCALAKRAGGGGHNSQFKDGESNLNVYRPAPAGPGYATQMSGYKGLADQPAPPSPQYPGRQGGDDGVGRGQGPSTMHGTPISSHASASHPDAIGGGRQRLLVEDTDEI